MPSGVYKRKSLIDRFMEKVGPPDANGCRPWLGPLHKGYGRFWFEGRQHRPHTLAAIAYYGAPDDPDFFGCHECDNRRCVNPQHIFFGDNKTNQQDAFSKGRHTSQNPDVWAQRAKLTATQVLDIFSSTHSTGELATQYHVSAPNICDIRKRRTWAHITNHLPNPVYQRKERVD